MQCWVVGASGLLGQSVVGRCRQSGWETMTTAVPWNDPVASSVSLRAGIDELLRRADGDRWSIAWCAGAGVVGTGQDVLDAEQVTFARFLDDLDARMQSETAQRGALFVSSSAGGVYAGSTGTPFTECTTPRPLAPYGVAKLQAEERTTEFAGRSGVPTLIGRISNLFGPGQNLHKPQGLISQVGRAYLTRQPISMYVSLDTMRDYLFVDDCATMIVRALTRLHASGTSEVRANGGASCVTKIFAAGRSTTIAAVLGEYRRIFKRRAPVVLGSSPSSRFQVRDLRLRSTVWTELDQFARTPLSVGITATVDDVSRQVQRAALPV